MGLTSSRPTQIDLYCSDNGLDHGESGLEDLTQEEYMRYNSFAEHGPRLQDTPPPESVASPIKEVPRELPTHPSKVLNMGLTLLQRALRMATSNLQLQGKSIVTFENILSSRSRWVHLRNRSEDSSSGMCMISLKALG